ncbi:MAG TPA: AAA domain-containing protein, partial [Pirellulales bacterium]
LIKNKGIRDTYAIESLDSEAEINPVVRHLFRRLYGIELPETIDLTTTKLDTLFDFLSRQIQASEPAVTLTRIDRPRIDLIHEKARRRLDQYRRSARISGRGVRRFGDMDYSYDAANYHPLGIKLFSSMVRAPANQLRSIIEEQPRPRHYATAPRDETPTVVETERSFFQLRDSVEENPYLWNFDLCNLTLANFRYRRMSLVRDYENVLQSGLSNAAFDATFSAEPRPLATEPTPAPAIEDRFDVVPCDPTQATAIAEARRGGNYIIQGPPGTGKSQTITNLIADFIARGKRVLFVCEKRAAIDVVFARLRQCGLGELCSLIHDSQTDKREFVQNIKHIYEHFLPEDTAKKRRAKLNESAGARLQKNLRPLEGFEAAMEAEMPGVGLSARRFLDRCIELAPLRPQLTPEEAERLPHYRDWRPHAERLDNLDRAVRDVERSGVLSRHPLRLLKPSLVECDRPIERVAASTSQALSALEQMADALRSAGVAADQWISLARATQLLDYLKLAAPIARGGNLSLTDSTGDPARRFQVGKERVRAATAALAKAMHGAAAWRQKLSRSDLRIALEQVRGMEGRLLAILSPNWWRMRGLLRRCYDFHVQGVRPTWAQALSTLDREYEAQSALDQAEAELRAEFGLREDPLAFADRVATLCELAPRLPAWLGRTHAELVKSPQSEIWIEAALRADAPAARLAAALEEIVVDAQELSIEVLRKELVAIGEQARQVPQILCVLAELERLPPRIAESLRELPLTVSQAEAATAHRTWEDLLRQRPDVARFDGRARTRYATQVESAYDAWLDANATEVRRRIGERFQENVRLSTMPVSQLSPEQREFKRRYAQGRRTLEHEFGKSMRYRAIRELVDGDASLVIQDLKPVWLMSPLSVSDTLPLPTNLFDVVIFDEASQIPLEESVPTLFRGQQVIIVGDEMQLPPTDFFAAKSTADEAENESGADDQSQRYDLDSDSLLNHAARNLPSTMLGWHYRSRSESLISFSNWAFYDGRLLTAPDCQAGGDIPEGAARSDEPLAPVDHLLGRAVSFHLRNSGVYDNRRNRAEARHIAELIRDLLLRRTGLSIGVIAFSEAQQGEIESAIQRLAQDDEEFRGLYEAELEREEDGQFVGLLVKNLENIQGDERDVVILSICYGPGPQGKMLMNFGPINKTGGEKRLNVAFSRAKRHMAVVSSIQHTAITNEYNDGANCLKSYLRYAEALSRGDLDGGQRVLAAISRWRDAPSDGAAQAIDPCCDQLATALAQRGYIVERSVGQSHFRIDLAVRLPEDTVHRLGILVDTAIQYEQS